MSFWRNLPKDWRNIHGDIASFLVSLQRQNAFIMKKKYLWMLFAIFAIVCSVSVITYHNSKEDAPSVSPTDNSSEFVTLTDAVPDAILEIRTRKGGGSGPLCLVYHAANIRKNRIW